MARRIYDEELRKRDGIDIPPLGTPTKVSVLKEIPLHKTFRGVFSFQFNYTGDVLAVGFGSEGIQLYDGNTGKMLKELRPCRQGGHSVMALRFHPKEPHILYAATTQGHIFVLNTETGEQMADIHEMGNEINALDFCVDGFNFVTGGRDLDVRVYETKSNKIVQHYEGYGQNRVSSGRMTFEKERVGNTMRIFALKFHPDNQYIFVSGGWDNHLKIWDTRANDGIKRNIQGPHVCGDSIDIKNNTILSGQWTANHALQEFDYTSGKVSRELHYPHGDGAFLYSSQYCNDNLVVAGGSGTNRAELIEISSNKAVGGFDLGAPVHAIDSTKNGRVVAVGGATSSFFLLKVTDSTG